MDEKTNEAIKNIIRPMFWIIWTSFQYKNQICDTRRKHAPVVSNCLGDISDRVYIASVWKNTSNTIALYNFKLYNGLKCVFYLNLLKDSETY